MGINVSENVLSEFYMGPEDGSSRFPETFLFIYPTARYHIPEDCNLNTHCCENVRSHTSFRRNMLSNPKLYEFFGGEGCLRGLVSLWLCKENSKPQD
jgi:hypothetical protein